MTAVSLRDRVLNGKKVYGTLVASISPKWPDVIKTLDLDFVFLDTEHIAIDRERLSWMCQTYKAMGLNPIVRIPAPDPHQANMVLDGGACGVVAPYVESPRQVRDLIGAVRLSPVKGHLLRDMLDSLGDLSAWGPSLPDYLLKRNSDRLAIVNIESIAALDALDEILAVPSLDAVLIGPHDLSCSLGIPEQYDHPLYEEAVHTVIQKAKAAQVGAGIHNIGDMDELLKWGRAGANLLIHSGDTMVFARQMQKELSSARCLLD